MRGEEQKASLISLAQARRKVIQEEAKQEASCILEKKLQKRTKALEKAKEKLIRHEHIKDLMSDTLITSTDELDRRMASITGLSIPKVVQEAEFRRLIKRQVMLHTKVYKQKGVGIALTEKGKPKPVLQLVAELSEIILSRPVRVHRRTVDPGLHQQLYTLFEKPSLLTGVKIKHRFEEDGSLTWYEGVITSYKRQQFTVHYKDTGENCFFTVSELKEDFLSGDLWIL